jgi:hypothetical protein
MIDHLEKKIRELKPFYEQNSVKGIFSWKEFEHLINLRPFMSSNIVNILGGENHTWEGKSWLTNINTYPNELTLWLLPRYMGYLQDCSKASENINKICSQLDLFNNCPTDAHIFYNLTDRLDQGFGIHADDSHNLIVQIEGETRMEIWDIEDIDNKTNTKSIDVSPVINVIMKPGDTVFIPKRYWHRASSQMKRLSVSFPSYPDIDVSNAQDRVWINIDKLL